MARILLGVPSSGMLCESSAQASWLSSLHHQVHRVPSCHSGPNFNSCLVGALNACDPSSEEPPQYDAHAQIHADIQVIEQTEKCKECGGKKCWDCGYTGEREYERWADILYREMVKFNADFISVPMAIKDIRLVTSCGFGNPENRWNPWRRLCANEFAKLPVTFCAEDVGYADKYLIHSNALCMFNMKSPIWWKTDAAGCIRAMFNFEERIVRDPVTKQWMRMQDSEDWAFSRRLWELGARTYITSAVTTLHHGALSFHNKSDAGIWQDGDESTVSQWRDNAPKWPVKSTA